MTRAAALALVLLAAAPAAATADCFTASTGDWRGPVLSGGHVTMMDAEFHAAGPGELAGSYTVFDRESYSGTLSGFHRVGPCEAEFAWTDKFGTGIVSIRFEPQLGQFLGVWGLVRPMYEHIFDGFRRRPDLES